jgi:hypothetical protein
VFKNPENAGMVGKISFQAKSYLFNLHEMFKNSGSGARNKEATAAVRFYCLLNHLATFSCKKEDIYLSF